MTTPNDTPEPALGDEFEEFDRRIELFLKRVDFARLEHVTGVDGVCAVWSELEKKLDKTFSGLRRFASDVDLLDRGLVGTHWVWRRGERNVSVAISVSSAGFAAVHEKLFTSSTETTMVRIPYGRGPRDLGDLALRHRVDSGDLIMWVYRNVFVLIDGDGPGLDLEPTARLIQQFMEARRVRRLAEHLPRVDRMDVSGRQVRVGDEWTVTLVLAKDVDADRVVVEFEQDRDADEFLLDRLRSSHLSAAYRALAPGTARVEIRVVDKNTLLSPPLAATVEILPAR